MKKQLQKNYRSQEKVWEKCDNLIHESKPKIESVKTDMQGLLDMISKVNKSLDSMPIYKAEKLIELIEKFNNMPAVEKELFTKLLQVSDMQVKSAI